MAKLSKILVGTALAGAAVAGTVAYLKKHGNNGTKDELKDFKEQPEFEDDELDLDCEDPSSYSDHKEEYKTIAAETIDGVKDIVVDTAKSLSHVVKDAYGKVMNVKDNVVAEEQAFFDDLNEDFEEFDDVLSDAKEEVTETIKEKVDEVSQVFDTSNEEKDEEQTALRDEDMI